MANELLKTLRAALKYSTRGRGNGKGEERSLSRASAMTNSIKEVSRNVATMRRMAGQNRMRQLTRGGSASASASAGTALPSDAMRRIAMQLKCSTKNTVTDTDTDGAGAGAGAWKWN